ncbi:MAG: FCD domain-containing protein [Mycobacterium sp.]
MTETSSKPTVSHLRPDRPISGYADVVDFIRRQISLGRLVPGDRLPSERRLAVELGVARETLRQGLRVLEGSGQITVTRGTTGGATVQDNSLAPEIAIHELRQRRESLLSLAEYRREIESIAARIAATRRTQADLHEMDSAQLALEDAPNKDEARRADTAFHLAVARAAGNPYLTAAIEDARAAMFQPVDLALNFFKEASLSQHELVLQGIRAEDGKAAGTAMWDHIECTRTEMQRMIDG